jgi:hypothetical protein
MKKKIIEYAKYIAKDSDGILYGIDSRYKNTTAFNKPSLWSGNKIVTQDNRELIIVAKRLTSVCVDTAKKEVKKSKLFDETERQSVTLY